MANNIQILKQTELLGQQFSVYGTPEEPLFLAKDVATWIEHTDVSKMVQGVDDDEKLTRTMFVSGQNREVWMLTENGFIEDVDYKTIDSLTKREIGSTRTTE